MRRWPALLLVVGLALGAAPTDGEVQQGQEAFARGDHAAALVHWALALDAARAAGDVEAELDVLLRLSAVYREIGRLETGYATLARAEALAADPAARGRVQLARGLLDLEAGAVRKAEKAFRDAFASHQEAADPHGAANAALDLGLALLAQGRDPEAGKAFAAAASLFSSLGDAKGRADALVNVAIVLRHRGALGEARGHLEEAVALYREVGDAPGEADALANLGLVLQDLSDDDAARELYDSALATARSRRDVERQATLLQNLGTLEHGAGDIARARAHYAAAEQAFASLGKEREAASVALDRASLDHDPVAYEAVLARARKAGDRRLEAVASLDLASALRGSDPKAAARHLARATALGDALQLRAVRWRAQYLAGLLELDRGRADKGIEALEAAVDELERTRLSLDHGDSARFVLGHRGVYVALIEALLARGDTVGAFVYAERLHLADLPDLPLPDDARADRFRALAAEEAWLSEALTVALDRGADTERADALRQQLAVLRVEFATTVDELRASYPEFDDLVRVDPEDLEAIQGDLDPGVVVIQPILFDNRLALLAFSKDRLVARSIEVDGAEVAAAVARLVRGLRAGDVYDPKRTREACDQLGRWLLDPIAAEIEGARVVVVSGDGVFRQLPFALLRHEGQWLVEKAAVVGVTHVGSLRKRSSAEARFRIDGPGMLLLGDPDGSLPGAEEEVRAISERFPGATVLTGADVSREALFAGAAEKKALHLATHGIIDPQRPDRSWLLLGDDEATDRLGYAEIPGLAPYLSSCRLVVLSACESGLPVDAPEPTEPGEVLVSINGLAAQFRRAGVETLIASLWRVDDRGTLRLMDGLYAELEQGTDVARALQRAQLALLREEDWSHPWYWAGFVVVGDWR